jgi:hypothetical protein
MKNPVLFLPVSAALAACAGNETCPVVPADVLVGRVKDQKPGDGLNNVWSVARP